MSRRYARRNTHAHMHVYAYVCIVSEIWSWFIPNVLREALSTGNNARDLILIPRYTLAILGIDEKYVCGDLQCEKLATKADNDNEKKEMIFIAWRMERIFLCLAIVQIFVNFFEKLQWETNDCDCVFKNYYGSGKISWEIFARDMRMKSSIENSQNSFDILKIVSDGILCYDICINVQISNIWAINYENYFCCFLRK